MARIKWDLEANGLLDAATKIHCMGWQVDHEVPSLHVGHEAILSQLGTLQAGDVLVAHNGIGFDLMVLFKVLKWRVPKDVVVEDTMTMSCLMFPDILGGHSLEEWGKRLGVHKIAYNGGWEEYTEEMGVYCLGDIDTLTALDDYMLKERAKFDWEVALKMEHTFAKDFAVQGMRGVMVDKPHCIRLLTKIDAEMDEIATLVEPLIPPAPGTKGEIAQWTPPKAQFKKDGTPSANCSKFFESVWEESGFWWGLKGGITVKLPHSEPLRTTFPATMSDQQHMKSWLMRMGWVPTMWSFKKSKDAKGKLRFVKDDKGQLIPTWPKFHDKGVLCPNLEFINTEFEHVGKAVRWVVIRHRRGLVQSIVDAIRPDGTVSATGFALGTPTSRVTHSVVANIPKADKEVVLGKECRSMFIARPGRTFVGVDASGLELRMLAHYVGTPELINMIVNGKKEDGTEIHTYLWNLCKPLVPSRSIQKNVTYGWLYGAGDKKLGQAAGHTDDKAEKVGKEIRRRMVAGVPGLDALMKKIEGAAKTGYILAMDGRRIEIRSKHATLNTLLQSAGSILVKWAQCYMNAKIREQRLDAWQVISYHDEVQLDAHPLHGKQAAELFVEGLKWAGKRFNVVCPLDGEVSWQVKDADGKFLRHTRSWAETH